MIGASLYHPFFIPNLLRYRAEKILLLNTTNFGGITVRKEVAAPIRMVKAAFWGARKAMDVFFRPISRNSSVIRGLP